jgi:hypothetical protein
MAIMPRLGIGSANTAMGYVEKYFILGGFGNLDFGRFKKANRFQQQAFHS